MPMLRLWIVPALLICFCTAVLAQDRVARDRETKVRNDKQQLEADEGWVYNDLEKGIAEAKRSGKPLLVVLRCVPCEACSKFDDQVVRRDPAVRELMDQYVCVRVVHANGMDLSLFQFDFDQSFAAFLMNADRTIYARFGTRSHHHDETQDMTMEGFGKALSAALKLHKEYQTHKASLSGKQSPPVEIKSPEKFPSLAGKYDERIHYEQANVVKTCIHCHQVREAERLMFRTAGKPIPERLLYPYPLPTVVGIEMDSSEMATIKSVQPNSPAERNGFRAGDAIVTLSGQPMLSIADVQWVLHNAEDEARLPAKVLRDGKPLELKLTLDQGWRRRQDISWRPTTWDLRRMATGGLTLEKLPDDDRSAAGIEPNRTALRVKGVGQYGAHAVAKKAGFQKGDVIVSVNRGPAPESETDFLAQALNNAKPGDSLAITVLREGKPIDLKLRQQ